MAEQNTPLRVLLVEDHAIVAEAVKRRGERSDGVFEVVDHQMDAKVALAVYRKLLPDVVICDVQLQPNMTGIEFTTELKSAFPDARVVMYSAHADAVTVQRALDAGALGMISKAASPDKLAEGIAKAGRGETVFDDSTAVLVIDAFRRGHAHQEDAPVVALSAREMGVLKLMCAGVTSNREIARELVLADHTIKSYVAGILAKLGVQDRTAAVAYAYRAGLVKPDAE